MAVITTPPEAAAMSVLRSVAVVTISSHLAPSGHRRAMTTRTLQPVVSTMQSETRLDLMLELPAHPTIRVVATLAVASQSLLVCIVRLVTRETGSVLDRKGMVPMTRFARSDCVQPEQRKAR